MEHCTIKTNINSHSYQNRQNSNISGAKNKIPYKTKNRISTELDTSQCSQTIGGPTQKSSGIQDTGYNQVEYRKQEKTKTKLFNDSNQFG